MNEELSFMKMTLANLTDMGCFNDIPEYYHNYIFEEWRTHGADKMVFTVAMMEKAVFDPEFAARFIKKAADHGLQFTDAHVPWYPVWALNTPPEYKEEMLKNNSRALELCGECGAKTLTIHVGDNICRNGSFDLQKSHDWLDATLEVLIPVAEKNKVVLCIENIIAPTDQPDELLRCFAKFPSPYFGCCYDSGHANVMENFPGKDPQRLCSWIKDTLWQGNPKYYEGDTITALLPHIVTCHLHDNDGYEDQHLPPGRGTVKWDHVLSTLEQAPRLLTIQNEANILRDGGTSIAALHEAFLKVGFQ